MEQLHHGSQLMGLLRLFPNVTSILIDWAVLGNESVRLDPTNGISNNSASCGKCDSTRLSYLIIRMGDIRFPKSARDAGMLF